MNTLDEIRNFIFIHINKFRLCTALCLDLYECGLCRKTTTQHVNHVRDYGLNDNLPNFINIKLTGTQRIEIILYYNDWLLKQNQDAVGGFCFIQK